MTENEEEGVKVVWVDCEFVTEPPVLGPCEVEEEVSGF